MSREINERIKALISDRRFSKAEISEKLGIGYSTLWRRLNGERSINVDFLSELAKVLGTSSSYLMGETDDPSALVQHEQKTLPQAESTQTSELSKETVLQEKPGHLIFKHGDYYVDVPDTPSNQTWFRELIINMLMTGLALTKEDKL